MCVCVCYIVKIMFQCSSSIRKWYVYKGFKHGWIVRQWPLDTIKTISHPAYIRASPPERHTSYFMSLSGCFASLYSCVLSSHCFLVIACPFLHLDILTCFVCCILLLCHVMLVLCLIMVIVRVFVVLHPSHFAEALVQ